jgi:phospholipase/carboxylesterase
MAREGNARLRAQPGASSDRTLRPGVHELGAAPPDAPTLLFVPPHLAAGAPLLVFFHGAGGAGAGSLRLVRGAATEHRCLVLLPTSVGRTWDVIVGRWGPDVERLDASLSATFRRFPVERVALGGFSDGASYALSLGLVNGDLAEALLAFSPGFAAPREEHGRPRVWISHGTQDAVLPIDRCGRPVARRLTRAGYEVTYEEFDGPHVVPPETVSRAFGWWLGAATDRGRPQAGG